MMIQAGRFGINLDQITLIEFCVEGEVKIWLAGRLDPGPEADLILRLADAVAFRKWWKSEAKVRVIKS